MKTELFRGAGVAIATPMHPDGSINYPLFEEFIDFQIENGTDAIIVCGTTGEAATMNHEEHLKTIETCVKKVNHRVPVIAGTGSNDTRYAVTLCNDVEALGVDGLLMVTPYYNKTSQAGLIAHYNYVADRVHTPIILYNVPSRTGCNIQPQTYAELSKHPNIIAAKEANGDIAALAQTLHLCGDDLAIYSGNDDQITPFLSLGGSGVISVLSNIMPKQTHEICQRFFDGNITGSAELQIQLIYLINALFSDVNPIPVKAALNLMGKNFGECRLPLAPMSDSARRILQMRMAEQGLL